MCIVTDRSIFFSLEVIRSTWLLRKNDIRYVSAQFGKLVEVQTALNEGLGAYMTVCVYADDKYMLFTGWEVRTEKIFCRGLNNGPRPTDRSKR
jgi:hypothetical protein